MVLSLRALVKCTYKHQGTAHNMLQNWEQNGGNKEELLCLNRASRAAAWLCSWLVVLCFILLFGFFVCVCFFCVCVFK